MGVINLVYPKLYILTGIVKRLPNILVNTVYTRYTYHRHNVPNLQLQEPTTKCTYKEREHKLVYKDKLCLAKLQKDVHVNGCDVIKSLTCCSIVVLYHLKLEHFFPTDWENLKHNILKLNISSLTENMEHVNSNLNMSLRSQPNLHQIKSGTVQSRWTSVLTWVQKSNFQVSEGWTIGVKF